ncbi:GlxA family transcriptional regulator [Undibacterium sp. Ren11W]|uniref:GlxA family transcriptional regulator n=1 Tax=Undibacterium sp. Ren11W TaxID=3413045 RepID=UPI003BF1E908
MSTLTKNAPIKIAVLAFDGISPFHLSVPCLVFGERHGKLSQPHFELSVCALASTSAPHTIQTNAGFSITTKHGIRALQRADMIVLPSWSDDLAVPPEYLLQALRKAHQRGARLVGLCLGAFVLAYAGLLDGRSATTHWALAGEFARRFPQISLDPNVLYVDHGDVITSAGTAAGIDCCLHLLRDQYGSELAANVARRLVVAPHRQGGQAQYIDHPLPTLASDTRLSKVLEWMLKHLAETQSLDQLAERALMSRRSFTRNFQKLTGTTVGLWLMHQRLTLAQRQLETSQHSIEQIASDTGFGSALLLRRHFSQHLQTSPSAYRRAFQGADFIRAPVSTAG